MDGQFVNNLINQLVQSHKILDEIETFCLVGSFVNDGGKEPQDIDCLIITTKKLSHKYIAGIISSIDENISLEYLDDSFRITWADIKFGLAYFYAKPFYKELEQITNGEKLSCEIKPWVIGGKIPEILLTDTISAKVMFDKSGKFNAMQRSLKNQYPPTLRKEIMDKLVQEFNLKIKIVEKTIENNYIMLAELGIGELQILLIRLIYADNKQYLPPIKHIQDNLSLIPENMRKTIRDILTISSLRLTEKLKQIKIIGSSLTATRQKK